MTKRTRLALLNESARNLARAADTGQLGNKPFRVHIDSISGCRVGALYIDVEVADAPDFFTALSKNDCAAARQIFAWDFQRPAIYWVGKRLRLEADWPEDLAVTDVALGDIGINPKGYNPKRNTRPWFPGINEQGEVIAMWLDDACPHVLIGGSSGSGKSVAMRNAIIQFATYYPEIKLVLMDAKDGEGLGPVSHVRGQVAPLATTNGEIGAALTWLVAQVRSRNQAAPISYQDRQQWRSALPPIYGFLDEIQEVAMKDGAVAESVRFLVQQGRSAEVHLIVGTQKPKQKVFGDDLTKSNISGRLALRTVNYKDSELIVGSNEPRADYLWPWEGWTIMPSDRYWRVQLLNVTDRELKAVPAALPEMAAYPALALAEAMGTLDGVQVDIDPNVGAAAQVSAHCGFGRGKFQDVLRHQGLEVPGSSKCDAYLQWARAANRRLGEMGIAFCEKHDGRKTNDNEG